MNQYIISLVAAMLLILPHSSLILWLIMKTAKPQIKQFNAVSLESYLSLSQPDDQYVVELATKLNTIYNDKQSEAGAKLFAGDEYNLTYNDSSGYKHLIHDNWISIALGQSEGEIVKKMQQNGNMFPMLSVASIDEAYNKIAVESPAPANAKIYYLVGCDAKNWRLLINSEKHVSIFVVASQMNGLESPTTDIAAVTNYPKDPTQGPQLVITTLANTLRRHAMAKDGIHHMLMNMFKDISEDMKAIFDKVYENGYFTPWQLNQDEKEKLIKFLKNKENIDKFLIIFEWSLFEASETNLKSALTVFVSAASYQDKKDKLDKLGIEICSLLLEPQFIAIGKLAIMTCEAQNKPVIIHLPRVGLGAFNNSPDSFYNGLKKLLELIAPYNDKIKLVYHLYETKDLITARNEMRDRTYMSEGIDPMIATTKEKYFQL